MDFFKNHHKKILLSFLVLLNLIVWVQVFSYKNKNYLRVVFLNVGQGDSIYIRAPSGNDMLIDSGPRDRSVLRELGAVMPWNDNDLDVILETHADADHIGGFPDILKRFKVGVVVETGNHSKTNTIDSLIEEIVAEQKVPEVFAKAGMKIDLGNEIIFEIIFPDKNVVGWETNKSSIVGVLSYGSHKFLLTGDSPLGIENYLIQKLQQENKNIDVDVLKPGHHGSKTSTSEYFLNAVTPEYAVISAGKNNRYGHPSIEVINKLKAKNIEIFQTAMNGRVEFNTNGTNLISILQFE